MIPIKYEENSLLTERFLSFSPAHNSYLIPGPHTSLYKRECIKSLEETYHYSAKILTKITIHQSSKSRKMFRVSHWNSESFELKSFPTNRLILIEQHTHTEGGRRRNLKCVNQNEWKYTWGKYRRQILARFATLDETFFTPVCPIFSLLLNYCDCCFLHWNK